MFLPIEWQQEVHDSPEFVCSVNVRCCVCVCVSTIVHVCVCQQRHISLIYSSQYLFDCRYYMYL